MQAPNQKRADRHREIAMNDLLQAVLAALAHAALTLGRRAAGLETAKSNRVKDWLIFPAELTEEQIQRVEQYFDGI